jgi:predicted transposase/invertase (TIGR01784 family)
MEFLDARSRGVVEMLAEKNKDIKKAYDLLQIISKDEKARMLYEARQAEISDQLTRIKSAEEKGREEGSIEKALRIAEKMLSRGDSVEDVIDITELPKDKILELKMKYQN